MERKIKTAKRSVDSAKRTPRSIGALLEDMNKMAAQPSPMTKDQAYTHILEWLYQNDGAYPNVQSWRSSLLEILWTTLGRIK